MNLDSCTIQVCNVLSSYLSPPPSNSPEDKTISQHILLQVSYFFFKQFNSVSAHGVVSAPGTNTHYQFPCPQSKVTFTLLIALIAICLQPRVRPQSSLLHSSWNFWQTWSCAGNHSCSGFMCTIVVFHSTSPYTISKMTQINVYVSTETEYIWYKVPNKKAMDKKAGTTPLLEKPCAFVNKALFGQ